MAILDHNGDPWQSNGTNGHAPEARFDPATGRRIDKDRLWGDDQFALPHVLTHASIYSTFRAYWHGKYDEAKKHSYETMLAMWNDTALRGMLNERIYNVLSLPWRIEVPNEKDPMQKQVRDHLTDMIEQIYDFHDICWSLLNAIWYGRSAVQWKWHWINHRGQESLTVKDWLYHNGDKIGGMHDGSVYIMVYAGVEDEDLPGAELIYTTEGGRGLIVKGSWKDRFCIHRHLVDDADFFGAEGADAIHGVGVRSVLYWLQYLKLEWLANITDYMERVGLGVTVIRYPSGNPQYKEEAESAAKQLMSSRTVILVPTFGEQNNRSVERIEVPMSGADMLWKLIQHVEEIQRIYVVGQTMSTGNDQSNSLGGTGRANFAQATKTQIRDNDAKKLSSTLTGNDERPGLLSIMQKWTFPETWPSRDNPNGFRARFVLGLEDKESSEKLQAATTMVKEYGLPVKKDEIYEVAGFTKPSDDDDVIGGEQMLPPGGEIDPETGLPVEPTGMPPDEGGLPTMDEVDDEEQDEPAVEEDYDLDESEPVQGTYQYADESPAAPEPPKPAAAPKAPLAPKAPSPGKSVSPAKPIAPVAPVGKKPQETIVAPKTTEKPKKIFATHPEHLSQHQPDQDWEPVQTKSGNVAHRNPYTGHVEYTPDKPNKPAMAHAQEHLTRRQAPPKVAPSNQPHVPEALKALHPSAAHPEGLAHLSGAQPGMQMQIYAHPDNPFHLQISGRSHQVSEMDRALRVTPQGELELHNNLLKVKRNQRGQGVGEKVFSQQVEQAAKSGIHRIKATAARGQGMSGYKVWPILGYNAPLDDEYKLRLQHNLSLPDSARNAEDVLDLYQTPEGRDWWAKHGQATEMTFDLHPGSKSMQTLQARRAQKGLPPLAVPTPEEYEATQQQRQPQLQEYLNTQNDRLVEQTRQKFRTDAEQHQVSPDAMDVLAEIYHEQVPSSSKMHPHQALNRAYMQARNQLRNPSARQAIERLVQIAPDYPETELHKNALSIFEAEQQKVPAWLRVDSGVKNWDFAYREALDQAQGFGQEEPPQEETPTEAPAETPEVEPPQETPEATPQETPSTETPEPQPEGSVTEETPETESQPTVLDDVDSLRQQHRQEQQVPFFHSTDLSRLKRINEKGLTPRKSREVEEGFEEPPAVWISRNDQYISHGPNMEINEPVILQGKIPLDFMSKHGVADSDYHFGTSDHYPSAQNKGSDEATWEDSYYYRGQPNERLGNYGGAGLLEGIPPEWISKIKYKGQWYDKDEFFQQHAETVNESDRKLKTDYLNDVLRGSVDVFRTENGARTFLSIYPEVKESVQGETRQNLDALFNMLQRRYPPEQGEPNATQEGQEQVRDQSQHQNRDESGQTPEAGGSDSLPGSGQEQQKEVATETPVEQAAVETPTPEETPEQTGEVTDADTAGVPENLRDPAVIADAKKEWLEKGPQSKYFKNWFGDWESDPQNASKVVDSEGKPLKVFHGTDKTFKHFENPFAETGWEMFSEDPKYSEKFTGADWKNEGGQTYQVYLDIKNPLDLSHIPARRGDARQKLMKTFEKLGLPVEELNHIIPYERDLFQLFSRSENKKVLSKVLQDAGFDGIKMPDSYNDIEAMSWIAFNPNQIKSATGNRGTFDPNKPAVSDETLPGQAPPVEPPVPEQAPESLFPEPEAQQEAQLHAAPETQVPQPAEPSQEAETVVPDQQPQVAVQSPEQVHEAETVQPQETPQESQAGTPPPVSGTLDPESTDTGPALSIPDELPEPTRDPLAPLGSVPLGKKPLPLPPTPTGIQPGTGRNPEYEAIGQQIATAPIIKQEPLKGGINAFFKVQLEGDQAGVWKPSSGDMEFIDEDTGQTRPVRLGVATGTGYRREVAFSSTANILGWSHLVPATAQKEANGEVGSVQHWIEGESAQFVSKEERFDGPEDLARAAVLDYLAGTMDRHSGNWMLKNTESGKQLALIDNGLSFPKEYNERDFIELNLLRRAYQNDLDMPDLSHWEGKWPELEQSYRDNGLEEEAIQLTKQRFDALVTASNAAKDAGTSWKLDGLPSWRERAKDMAHMLDMVVVLQKLTRKKSDRELEATAARPVAKPTPENEGETI